MLWNELLSHCGCRVCAHSTAEDPFAAIIRCTVLRFSRSACKPRAKVTRVARRARPRLSFATNGFIKLPADPAKVDKRTRSKWSRALRYALRYKFYSEPLGQFIKHKGGINECADRFAKSLGWRRSR